MTAKTEFIAEENCPRCHTTHGIGHCIPRPDLKKDGSVGMPYAPPDVQCSCGAKLRAVVPLCKVTDSGYEWRVL